MTGPERIALDEAIVSSGAMADHLRRLRQSLTSAFPIDEGLAGGSDPAVEQLHAFARMFEQLYDVTARQLFQGLLLLLGEDYRRASFKEVVRRLERIERLSDGNRWLALGETRNTLVHDYAVTKAAFAGQLNRAWADLDDLLRMHLQTIQYLEAEGLAP